MPQSRTFLRRLEQRTKDYGSVESTLYMYNVRRFYWNTFEGYLSIYIHTYSQKDEQMLKGQKRQSTFYVFFTTLLIGLANVLGIKEHKIVQSTCERIPKTLVVGIIYVCISSRLLSLKG